MKNSVDEDLENESSIPLDFVLPLMKNALPEGFVISKEAVEAVQECVSWFATYIIDETFEFCECDEISTVRAEYLINTLQVLGFEKYPQPLRIFLKNLRKICREHSSQGVGRKEDKNVVGETDGDRESDFMEGNEEKEVRKIAEDEKGDGDLREGVGEEEEKINGGTEESGNVSSKRMRMMT